MPSELERAFFDRIRDEPGEDGPRLIFADWLDEDGQSDRAEFIRLQCALARLTEDDPQRSALRERERILADRHEENWKQELAPYVVESEFRRGVIDSVSVYARQFIISDLEIFELAPVRKVRFLKVGDLMPPLVESGVLRRVREIDLSGNYIGNRGLSLLARSPHLGRLDSLNLGFTEIGDRGLQTLAGSPAFSSLCALQINHNGRLGVPGLRALAESPHLTELIELDVSGNSLSEAALQPIFDGPLGQRLHKIALIGNSLGDAGITAFARSMVFTRMAETDGMIDLSRVEMGPTGAKALAESQALLAVESLDLEENVLGDAGLIALAGSAFLKNLRVLSLRKNRVSDDGVRVLARSPLMKNLRVLDLTGNLITQDSADRLHEASVKYDWRGLLQLKVDSQLRIRPIGAGPLGNYFRRPPS